MRVKHAVQVLSEEEGLATLEAVDFFNNLFDSVNGDAKNDNSNELRRPVTENSKHHAFWVSAKNKLHNMAYVEKMSHKIITSVPSLKNWLFTVNGFEKLWKVLHDQYNFHKLNTLNNMKSVSLTRGNCEESDSGILSTLEKYLQEKHKICNTFENEESELISNINVGPSIPINYLPEEVMFSLQEGMPSGCGWLGVEIRSEERCEVLAKAKW
ncbi:hypothetical protein DBV15_11510 [Temnothorax longispinosus]|uniref:Uncharacterized protein n=1 Tax=Temnothorax longispinosus TaxID=300112 RepID=A0A4S2KSJ4_9HYME|nr:hypothetical protein DBV15_11510 [Temnothorax longispinosus]